MMTIEVLVYFVPHIYVWGHWASKMIHKWYLENVITRFVLEGAVISEDMVKDGYKHIVNIDISQVVIDAMKIKYKHLPQLECKLNIFISSYLL
jgi:hypothetical protein